MARFLLIHGSWHGAWCWYKVAPLLRKNGHAVFVPDLLGRKTTAGMLQTVSLQKMIKTVGLLLSCSEKTTIVVHSRYGILASSLAERFPDRIARVIYLASYMIPSGRSAAAYFQSDKDSALWPFISISKTGLWDSLHPDIYKDGLYHDCSDADTMLGHCLLTREPLRPALAKLKLTDENYGRVPRVYIRLSADRAVSPALQDRCLNETPVDRVENINAGHSAYFSQPEALTNKILLLNS